MFLQEGIGIVLNKTAGENDIFNEIVLGMQNLLRNPETEISGNGNQEAGKAPGNLPAGIGRESGIRFRKKSGTGGNREWVFPEIGNRAGIGN